MLKSQKLATARRGASQYCAGFTHLVLVSFYVARASSSRWLATSSGAVSIASCPVSISRTCQPSFLALSAKRQNSEANGPAVQLMNARGDCLTLFIPFWYRLGIGLHGVLGDTFLDPFGEVRIVYTHHLG